MGIPEKFTIRELRAIAHLGTNAAAARFGVSRVCIWKWAKRYGIEMTNQAHGRAPKVLTDMTLEDRHEYDSIKAMGFSRLETLDILRNDKCR